MQIKREDLGPTAKKIVEAHLGVEITEEFLVGEHFTQCEQLQMELSVRLPNGVFVNSPKTTFAQMVESLEKDWDTNAALEESIANLTKK